MARVQQERWVELRVAGHRYRPSLDVGRIEHLDRLRSIAMRDRNDIPIARPVGAHTRHERRRMKELTGLANVHVLDLHRQQVEPGQRGRNGLDGKVARCHELVAKSDSITVADDTSIR